MSEKEQEEMDVRETLKRLVEELERFNDNMETLIYTPHTQETPVLRIFDLRGL